MIMRKYYTMLGVGKAKYVVCYHDGEKKHKDGSEFYDVQIFKNIKDLKAFTNDLRTQGYKLQIIATNLDSWLTSIIPIKNLSIEKTAIFTIDAKTLIKIIKTIKSNELIFNYSINDFKLQLAFEETIITMNCHEEQTASFPQQPIAKQNDNCSFYLYSQELFQALKTTSFAASNDDLRPALNNININGGDWRSKSLALPFMFSTTLDGFYFANCVLAAVFFLFDYQHFIK